MDCPRRGAKFDSPQPAVPTQLEAGHLSGQSGHVVDQRLTGFLAILPFSSLMECHTPMCVEESMQFREAVLLLPFKVMVWKMVCPSLMELLVHDSTSGPL